MKVNTPYRSGAKVSEAYSYNVEVGDFVDVIITKEDGTIYTERE